MNRIKTFSDSALLSDPMSLDEIVNNWFEEMEGKRDYYFSIQQIVRSSKLVFNESIPEISILYSLIKKKPGEK